MKELGMQTGVRRTLTRNTAPFFSNMQKHQLFRYAIIFLNTSSNLFMLTNLVINGRTDY